MSSRNSQIFDSRPKQGRLTRKGTTESVRERDKPVVVREDQEDLEDSPKKSGQPPVEKISAGLVYYGGKINCPQISDQDNKLQSIEIQEPSEIINQTLLQTTDRFNNSTQRSFRVHSGRQNLGSSGLYKQKKSYGLSSRNWMCKKHKSRPAQDDMLTLTRPFEPLDSKLHSKILDGYNLRKFSDASYDPTFGKKQSAPSLSLQGSEKPQKFRLSSHQTSGLFSQPKRSMDLEKSLLDWKYQEELKGLQNIFQERLAKPKQDPDVSHKLKKGKYQKDENSDRREGTNESDDIGGEFGQPFDLKEKVKEKSDYFVEFREVKNKGNFRPEDSVINFYKPHMRSTSNFSTFGLSANSTARSTKKFGFQSFHSSGSTNIAHSESKFSPFLGHNQLESQVYKDYIREKECKTFEEAISKVKSFAIKTESMKDKVRVINNPFQDLVPKFFMLQMAANQELRDKGAVGSHPHPQPHHELKAEAPHSLDRSHLAHPRQSTGMSSSRHSLPRSPRNQPSPSRKTQMKILEDENVRDDGSIAFQIQAKIVRDTDVVQRPCSREAFYMGFLRGALNVPYEMILIGGIGSDIVHTIDRISLITPRAQWSFQSPSLSELASTHFKLYGHDGDIYQGKVYLFGGYFAGGPNVPHCISNDLFEYSPSDGSIQKIRGPEEGRRPKARTNHCCAVVGSWLVVQGGKTEHSEYIHDCWIFCMGSLSLIS